MELIDMELIDNVNKTLAEDLRSTLTTGSRVSIAASCFSIYAYQELKKELKQIDELRFIFTSPTFITEKSNKAQRESQRLERRMNKERSLNKQMQMRSQINQWRKLLETIK